MYSILKAYGLEERKAKGVKKVLKKAKGVKKFVVVKKHISHAQDKEVLFEGKRFRHGMDMLRSCRLQNFGEHVKRHR